MTSLWHWLSCAMLLSWISGCVTADPTSAPTGERCVDHHLGYVAPANSVQRAVLVLASDAHPQTVRRNLLLVDRVGRSLMNPLVRTDVRLFDVHGLRAPLPSSPRVTVQRLLEAANNDAREPIDRLVIYSVFADTYPVTHGFRASLRVAAQLYDLPGGNLLVGNFEAVEEMDLKLPTVCDSACFIALVGDAARPLGQAVGQSLSAELQAIGNSYPLELFGFSNAERLQIERGIRGFPGYRSHRVEEDGAQYVRLRYASSLAAADLGQNLRSLTSCLALPSQIEFAGARYAVRRSTGAMVHSGG